MKSSTLTTDKVGAFKGTMRVTELFVCVCVKSSTLGTFKGTPRVTGLVFL